MIPPSLNLEVGVRIRIGQHYGTIRYIGEVRGRVGGTVDGKFPPFLGFLITALGFVVIPGGQHRGRMGRRRVGRSPAGKTFRNRQRGGILPNKVTVEPGGWGTVMSHHHSPPHCCCLRSCVSNGLSSLSFIVELKTQGQ